MAHQRLNRFIQRRLLLALSLQTVLILLALLFYHHRIATRIQTIDLKGYLERQRELYQSQKINDATLQRNLAELEHLMNSQPKNRIFLLKEVVLGTLPALPLP